MPTAQSEAQLPHLPRGAFRGWNSIAWRVLLPVPITLVVAIGLIWATMPRLMENTAANLVLHPLLA